jgi:hypothetical protein
MYMISHFKLRFFLRTIPFVVLLILVGCGSHESPPGATLESFSVVATEDVNLDSAITMDLVVIYDKELLNTLNKMTSEQYYGAIGQIRRDNDTLLDIWRWEMVPNQVLENYDPVFDTEKTWGILVFADYKTQGAHRAGIGKDVAEVVVTLGKKDIASVNTSTEITETDVASKKIYPGRNTIRLTQND